MIDTPVGDVIDGIIHGNLGGEGRDGNDQRMLKHGRLVNAGFKIGNYIQTPPMFFTRDGHAVPLIDRYRGYPAFFICGGPSFADVDKEPLKRPGVLTMGYNNVVKVFRPNFWTGIDNPTHFLQSIWMDPTIEKYVPFDHADKHILDSFTKQELPLVTGDCPSVWYFRRNELFNAERFLFEDTLNWGNHKDWGGARSGILAAIRILFLLGIRTVYLLGVDFNMSPVSKYCFDQDRDAGAIHGNNITYQELIKRFTILRPIFEKHGFNIYNCNPNSNLKVFDHVPYEVAIKTCTDLLPPVQTEPTTGFYELATNKKKLEAKKQKELADVAHGVAPDAPIVIDPTLTLSQAETLKRAATKILNRAKSDLETLQKQPQTTAVMEQITLKSAEISELRTKRKHWITVFDKLAGNTK